MSDGYELQCDICSYEAGLCVCPNCPKCQSQPCECKPSRKGSKPMDYRLTLEEQTSMDDKTGRVIITFIPVLTARCTASGSLRFACWQVWQDEPETHMEARRHALRNARLVISTIGKEQNQ